MFILFFAVWILLNGRFTLETALFGVVISLLLYLFCCRFMHYSLARDLETAKRLPRLISLFFVLVWEIMKAGFALLPYIYGGKKPDPAVVRFKTNIQSDTGRVFLANCITMTPGTITGSLKESEYLVHCLDRSMGQGLEDGVFVKKILRWEEK